MNTITVNIIINGKADISSNMICHQIFKQIINKNEKDQVCKFVVKLREIASCKKPTNINVIYEIKNYILYNQFVKEFIIGNRHVLKIKKKKKLSKKIYSTQYYL